MSIRPPGMSPTRPAGDSSNANATTEFVIGALGGSLTASSYAAAQASSPSLDINTILLLGYYGPDGKGRSQYQRTNPNAQPAHPGWLLTANGLYFELVEKVPDYYMFGAYGDNSHGDRAAAQNCYDYVQLKFGRGTVALPYGFFIIDPAASPDAYSNGIVVRFKTFNAENGIVTQGYGGTLVAGGINMTVLRLCQPGSKAMSITIDCVDRTHGNVAIAAVPENINQTTTIVSQSFVHVDDCTLLNFDTGFLMMPGPDVGLSGSGAFFPVFTNNYMDTGITVAKFTGNATAPTNLCTRGNIAFNTALRCSVGYNLDLCSEFDCWGNEFELFDAAHAPAGPLGYRCCYNLGANTFNHKIYGGWAEACDQGIHNVNAANKNAATIRDWPRGLVNINCEVLPKLHTDWLVLSPDASHTTGTMRVAGYFAGGCELIFDTAGDGTRNVAIATGTSVIRQSWGVIGAPAGGDHVTTLFGSAANVVFGPTGLTMNFSANGAVISFGAANYTLTHSAGNLVAAGGPFTAPAIAVTGSAVPANGVYLPAAATLGWAVGSVAKLQMGTTFLAAATDGGLSLGTTSFTWNGLNLANATAINWASNFTLTHSTGIVTASGEWRAASFTPTGSTVPANGLYLPAANTLGWAVSSAGEVQLTGTAFSPMVNDGTALGTTALMWADAFLANGAVINFNNGNLLWTHSAGTVTQSGSDTTFILSSSSSGGFSDFGVRNDGSVLIDFVCYGSAFAGTNLGINRTNLGLLSYNGSQALIVRTTGSAPLVFGTSAEGFRLSAATGEVQIASAIPLRLGNTAVASGAVVNTHTVTVKDLGGTTYRLLCLV